MRIRYDYRLLSLLNLLGVANLNFLTCNGCRHCYSADVLLCETIGHFTVVCLVTWVPFLESPGHLPGPISILIL